MEKIKNFLKKSYGLLVVSVFISFILSFFAALVHTAGFSVKVEKITVNMDEFYAETYEDAVVKPSRVGLGEVNAKLTGLLYMPRGVDEDSPAPCVILTHGYLNSKEFQEAPAIEMARRGYVVFAFDQYDHGDSTWDTPAQFRFFQYSVYDAAEYMYAQPYVLKDADGNGMISVSGHSMGGFSSELAIATDESNFAYGIKKHRMIAAGLAVGADFTYTGDLSGYFGSRSVGNLYGEYDEFFFNSQSKNGETVTIKDYAKDPNGYKMLGLTAAGENNKWYAVDPSTNTAYESYEAAEAGYGERIIIKVKGDHPYNTWSPEATREMIEFYDHAFEYQLKLHGLKPLADYGIKAKSGQIWWLKDVFTCLGLFSTVAMMILLINFVARLPFFRKVNTAAESMSPVVENTRSRTVIGKVVTVISVLLSGYLIVPFMNRSGTGLELVTNLTTAILTVALFLGVGLGIAYIVLRAKGEVSEESNKNFAKAAVGITAVSVVAVVLKWVVGDGTSIIAGTTNKFWAAPSINTIVYWAVASGLLGLIFTLIDHFAIQKQRDISHLGLKANFKQVAVAFIIAVGTALAALLLVWLSLVIFGVDYRVYTYAFNTVSWNQFVVALRYMPLFFVFYLCSGITVAHATAGKKGIVADLIAVAIITLPSALWIAYQYGVLLTTGKAAYPAFALSGILVQGLILTLVFLSVIQRRTLAKTNNIWVGVFTNTIWFTLITLASTCIYILA